MSTCSLQSCDWSDETDSNVGTSCSWSTDGDEEELSSPVNVDLASSVDSSVSNWTPSPTKSPLAHSTPVNMTVTPEKKGIDKKTQKKSVRHSPRVPKVNRKYVSDSEPSPSHSLSEKWDLFMVMNLNGCQEHCASSLHGLSEYDILITHSNFVSMTSADQRVWVYDYFNSHCPNDEDGKKTPTGIQFFLCGRNVCLSVWLAALGISNSRFYDLRKQFLECSGPPAKKPRSLSSKMLAAISWMSSYFNKIGDKRPDKDGIYLPTCLTESAIYSRKLAVEMSMMESVSLNLTVFFVNTFQMSQYLRQVAENYWK